MDRSPTILEDLKRAQALAHIGSWRLDIARNEFACTREAVRILGRPAGGTLTSGDYLALVHEDDRAAAERHWQLVGEGHSLDVEHRIRVDGEVRWVRVRAESEYDTHGRLVGCLGTFQDVTDDRMLEDDLRASRLSLQAALDIADIATWGWDELRRHSLWTAHTKKIFGLPSDAEVTRALVTSLLHPEDVARDEAAWAAATDPDGARTYSLEYRIRRASDGVERWISSRATVEFRDRRPVRVLGALRDITEQKTTEMALRSSEERFRNVFERSQTGIAVVNWAGELDYCNAAFAELVGYRDDELRGMHYALFVHPDERSASDDLSDRFRADEISQTEGDTRYIRKDGTEIWVRRLISLLPARPGEAPKVLVNAVDVTRQREAELAAIDEGRELRFIADHAPVMIARLDQDLRFLFANEGYAARFGRRPEQIVGRFAWEVFGDKLFDEASPHIAMVRAGKPVDYDLPVEATAGQVRHVHISYTPEFAADGSVSGFLVSVTDITDRKLAENRLRTFIEEAPAAIAMFDRDVRYLAASRRWLDYFCPEESDLTGRLHLEVFPDLPEQWKQAHQRGLAGEVLRGFDDPYPRADGRVQYLRWELRPWHLGDGSIGGITIVSEDVTEHVLRERALRVSEERLRLALQGSGGGVWDWDLHTGIAWWSEEMYDLWGVARGSDITLETSLERVHPEERADVERAVATAIAAGALYRHEFRILHAWRGERWVSSFGQVMPGEDGRPERLIGLTLDVTERKRQMLLIEQLNRRLEESNDHLRLITDAVGHDLTAPLRQLRKLGKGIDEDVREGASLDDIANRARRMSESAELARSKVESLLDYARIGHREIVSVEVDVGQILSEIARLVAAGSGVKIEAVGVLPVFETAEAPLFLVLRNLIDNAVKFHDRAEGRVGVIAREEGGFHVFRVEDDGPGIDPQHFREIFVPFRKGDSSKPGHGMGLALVKRTVETVGGRIEVASGHEQGGRGTRFTVFWPKRLAGAG